jgi:CSLREA domain-containing protein
MMRFINLSIIVLVLLLGAPPVGAATFTVTSTGDTSDAIPGKGICDDGSGACTLRAAVEEGCLRPALLLDEGRDPADLDGAADLVERVAVVAHDAAGLGDVAQLLGELEQGELPSSTLGQGGHSVFSFVGFGFVQSLEPYLWRSRVSASLRSGEDKAETVGELRNYLSRGGCAVAAELPAVVGQHGADRHAQGVVEGQHSLLEQLAGRDWHLRRVHSAKASEQNTSTTTWT